MRFLNNSTYNPLPSIVSAIPIEGIELDGKFVEFFKDEMKTAGIVIESVEEALTALIILRDDFNLITFSEPEFLIKRTYKNG